MNLAESAFGHSLGGLPGKVTCMTIQERVERGAALLDSYHSTWYRGIEVDRLTIQNPDHCVLTQVFGGFVRGLQYIGLETNSGATWDHGFCEIVNEREIVAEWTQQILRRIF
jgi:hypothetical protein